MKRKKKFFLIYPSTLHICYLNLYFFWIWGCKWVGFGLAGLDLDSWSWLGFEPGVEGKCLGPDPAQTHRKKISSAHSYLWVQVHSGRFQRDRQPVSSPSPFFVCRSAMVRRLESVGSSTNGRGMTSGRFDFHFLFIN